MQFPNVVTSSECLTCKGCCSFESFGGDWSPRLTDEDVALLESFSSLKEWRQGTDRIVLKPSRRGQACFFLDEKTHHCQAYHLRPYECRLYPFLLSLEDGCVRLYAHLSCPAIEKLFEKEQWRKEISLIRVFFQRQDVIDWVKKHAQRFVDYRPFLNEIRFLFDVLSTENSQRLLKKKKLIDAQMALRESNLSSRHYSQLFVWKDFFVFDVIEKEANTLVFARQPVGAFLYWPPLGKEILPQHIQEAFEMMEAENGRASGISRIENVSQQELKFFDIKKYEARQRGYEYIYQRGDLALLKGKKYHAQRHEINKLHQQGNIVYRSFEKKDSVECQALFDAWLMERKKKNDERIYQTLLEESCYVHQCVLQYAHALELIGRVVEVNGEIKAYTFGYFLSDRVFCVFLEIADVSMTGVGAFIFHMFMKDPLLKNVTLVNTMDDFGMPNIAQTKEYWHPVEKLPVYTIYKKY